MSILHDFIIKTDNIFLKYTKNLLSICSRLPVLISDIPVRWAGGGKCPGILKLGSLTYNTILILAWTAFINILHAPAYSNLPAQLGD